MGLVGDAERSEKIVKASAVSVRFQIDSPPVSDDDRDFVYSENVRIAALWIILRNF